MATYLPNDQGLCGICGQPLAGPCHASEGGFQVGLDEGRVVEYAVTGLRGAFAYFQAIDDPSDRGKASIKILAAYLQLRPAQLREQRFVCRVVHGADGATRPHLEPESSAP
jgi:hypothetical protein